MILSPLILAVTLCGDNPPDRVPYRPPSSVSSSIRPLGPYNDVQQRLREIDAQVRQIQDKMIEQERRQGGMK